MRLRAHFLGNFLSISSWKALHDGYGHVVWNGTEMSFAILSKLARNPQTRFLVTLNSETL